MQLFMIKQQLYSHWVMFWRTCANELLLFLVVQQQILFVCFPEHRLFERFLQSDCIGKWPEVAPPKLHSANIVERQYMLPQRRNVCQPRSCRRR